MPSKSEKQRRFMGAELSREREGKKTKTGMNDEQLSEFASKPIEKSLIERIDLFIAKAPMTPEQQAKMQRIQDRAHHRGNDRMKARSKGLVKAMDDFIDKSKDKEIRHPLWEIAGEILGGAAGIGLGQVIGGPVGAAVGALAGEHLGEGMAEYIRSRIHKEYSFVCKSMYGTEDNLSQEQMESAFIKALDSISNDSTIMKSKIEKKRGSYHDPNEGRSEQERHAESGGHIEPDSSMRSLLGGPSPERRAQMDEYIKKHPQGKQLDAQGHNKHFDPTWGTPVWHGHKKLIKEIDNFIEKQEGIKGYGAVTGKAHLKGRQYGEKTVQGKQRKVSEAAQEKHSCDKQFLHL